MAGRRRKKLKSLIETMTDAKRASTKEKNEPQEQQTWSELPPELLELIMCRLTLKENLCASSVCKRWLSVAISVRVVNQPPWIMHFPKCGDMYELYDPSERKAYSVEFPELHGSRACYAKDGWLLLHKPRTQRVFFFNPFTRDLIKLPRYEMGFQRIAFSSSPTSPDCTVFTVINLQPTIDEVVTCQPGDTEWTRKIYQNHLPLVSSVWNKLLFCKGSFYCLSLTGSLGIFNPQELTWMVCAVSPPKCPETFFAKYWWKGKFMLEHQGDIFSIYTCSDENPILFKLNHMDKAWEEVKTLGGLTFFASFLSSHARTDLLGMMRNSVYFPKVRFYGKRCISYSLDNCRYYPKNQFHDWGEQDPFENIWIEPPKDLSTFLS